MKFTILAILILALISGTQAFRVSNNMANIWDNYDEGDIEMCALITDKITCAQDYYIKAICQKT